MVTRRDVFSAVFPSAAKATVPTPSSTPQLSSAPFGETSFVFPNVAIPEGGDRTSRRIKWERAWHSATSFLGLRNALISPPDDEGDEDAVKRQWIKSCSAEVSAAISYLNSERVDGHPEDNLIDWYTHEVGRHYTQFQLPFLLKILSQDAYPDLLSDILEILRVSQAVYFYPLREHVIPSLLKTGRSELTKFQEAYHAMVALSLSNSSFAAHLGRFLKRQGSVILSLEVPEDLPDENGMQIDEESLVAKTRSDTLELMRHVDQVGLGGAQAQRIFAEVMSGLLTAHVQTTYAEKWSSPSDIPNELSDWVENVFARFVVEVLSCLRRENGNQAAGASPVSFIDLANWKHRAICDLGGLRVKELFDIIVDWDNDSKGAIEDLKQYLTTTAARSHLTDSFSAVISHRLLHPGASTMEILKVYVSIIRVFSVLDPKGVLLDRLARPIRRYLRERDDKARIIVEGLLADTSVEAEESDALIELSAELDKATENPNGEDDDDDLDYDDMNWLPDPVDVGPDYKRSKSHDVIGTLISLFESQDVFVRELQNILGERLLLPHTNLEKETRVLELLKVRFGDTPFQACEVMLKDIVESRRTDTLIQRRGQLQTATGPQIHAKILSRFFWPSLSTNEFAVPPSILSLQAQYATAFEAIKPTRKLTWLQSLGFVTVEIQLQDRMVEENVHLWQASVIHAFQDESTTNKPVTRTVDKLASNLSMPLTLLLPALQFWVSKFVLHETAPDTYTVRETLSALDLESSTANPSAFSAAGASFSAAGGGKSAEEIMMEKMEEFWPYIVGMLTNQGQMKAGKIVNLLKFVVPGGFPLGVEEVREFMRAKVEEKKCEMVGGAYKIVK